MKTQLVALGKQLMSHLGMYRPARFLYNALSMAGTTRIAEINGILCTFRTPTHTIAEYVDTLTGEGDVLRHFLTQIRPDDIIWDIGAGFGLYTVFAQRIATQGMVYVFEPEPRSRVLLSRNLSTNNASRVQIFPFALGDANAEVMFYRSDTPNVGTHALVQRNDFRLKKRGIRVAQRTGDSLVRDGTVPLPTLMKIDVEGAECKVLAGMDMVLRNPSLRSVYCEIHPRVLPLFGTSPAMVEQQLTLAGFVSVERSDRGTEYHIVYSRPS